MALFAAGFAGLCAAQQSKGSIAGTVTSTAGEPLKNASVRLQGQGSAQMVGPPVYTATSDAQGSFSFDNVDPGRYTLVVQRTGYLPAFAPASGRVDLTGGGAVTGITVKMTPQSVISGTITDEDGDPVPNARIQVARWGYQNGMRRLVNAGGASSNVEGVYAVGNLQAGSYVVSAAPLPQPSGVMRQKGPEETFTTTFYPGVTDASSAGAVQVTAGATLRGLDLRMRKVRAYRVRGKVAGSSTNPTGSVRMMPEGGPDLASLGLNLNTTLREGAFEIDGVLPGVYALEVLPVYARGGDGNLTPSKEMGRMTVTVGNQDVDDIVLQLGPGAEISGKITYDGTPPQAQQAGTPGMNAQPMVRLVEPESQRVASNRPPSPDGSFALDQIMPGSYQVQVMPLPPGLYVKSIKYGSQDLTKSLLDLRSGSGGEISVVLSYNVADISGTVHGADGQPLSGVALTLWTPGTPSSDTVDFTRVAATDSNGQFKFADLPPGDYRVAAWEHVDDGLAMVPEFRANFESKAAAVKVSEGDHAQAEAPLIPADAIAAVAATLQ